MYFRMHHFVVKFPKFSSPQAARGIDPLPLNQKSCGRSCVELSTTGTSELSALGACICEAGGVLAAPAAHCGLSRGYAVARRNDATSHGNSLIRPLPQATQCYCYCPSVRPSVGLSGSSAHSVLALNGNQHEIAKHDTESAVTRLKKPHCNSKTQAEI